MHVHDQPVIQVDLRRNMKPDKTLHPDKDATAIIVKTRTTFHRAVEHTPPHRISQSLDNFVCTNDVVLSYLSCGLDISSSSFAC
jgi:hypothetical protein